MKQFFFVVCLFIYTFVNCQSTDYELVMAYNPPPSSTTHVVLDTVEVTAEPLPCVGCENESSIDFSNLQPGQEIQDTSTMVSCPWAIQIGSYRRLITAPSGTVVVYSSGLYKYYYSKFFATAEDARKFMKLSVIQEDYPEAFVTRFTGFAIFK